VTPQPVTRFRLRWALTAVRAVLAHPTLWSTGIRQVRILARPGWWRRPPFLPVPDPSYLRFRLETAYGGAGDHPPEPADVVAYLRWLRHERVI
jgi:hypothetical protein